MNRLFVTVLEGESPETAQPLIATEDPKVVAAVAKELLSRFKPDTVSQRPFLLITGKKQPSGE